ncbi:MAG: FesM [Planctomycetaceae bacterium]|nr:FesM [Planctomycetaceae bacterium]
MERPLERGDPQSPGANGQFDLLEVPLLGGFLRWRWSRTFLQLPVLLLSLLMIAHAFFGPQLAPKNLAALLTWVHFRGLVVLVLLVGGNFFCMACPFMLPRELARRFVKPSWRWPRILRNKWPSIICLVGVLFAYELFDLWGSPWWTGALIVGYFAAAFAIDTAFERASFCKYVCPVGQFNFLSATMSPLEVKVRQPDVCHECTTKDCIRGRHDVNAPCGDQTIILSELPIIQRGCELALFQPRKVGNLDCTFCLDCVYACPHDNIGIIARLPGEELAGTGTRSGIGNLDKNAGWTVLTAVFVFGALLNAFAMTSPVYVLEQEISRWTGLRVEWPILGMLFMFGLIIEPAILLGTAAAVTQYWTHSKVTMWGIINRFARSLIPLGFGIWLAHYGFHFFTGALTIIPVTQNACRMAFGLDLLGKPMWQMGGLPESVVYPMELGFLGLGLLGSLLVCWRIASQFNSQAPTKAFFPWSVVIITLFVSACWILTQPMDMRGTFLGG